MPAVTFHARRFWSAFPFSWTKVFMPDRIDIYDDRVQVTKRTMFGLRSNVEEVRYDRIASVRVAKKVVTAALVIETSGGSVDDLSITALPKRSAGLAADEVRSRLA